MACTHHRIEIRAEVLCRWRVAPSPLLWRGDGATLSYKEFHACVKIITTRAGNPFGRMDPVSLYRRADPSVGMDSSRWICWACQQISICWKSIPGEIYPRINIRRSVHTHRIYPQKPIWWDLSADRFYGVYGASVSALSLYSKSQEGSQNYTIYLLVISLHVSTWNWVLQVYLQKDCATWCNWGLLGC